MARFAVIKVIDEALAPLSCLTDMLSGEEHVTVSVVIPMLCLMETKILKEKDSDTQLTKDLKQRIYTDIKLWYDSYDPSVLNFLNMASVLDPCFKLDYVDSEIVPELKKLLLSEGEEIGREATRSATSSTVPSSTEPPPKKRNLSSLFKEKEDHDNLPILSPAQRINAEMQTYLNRPKLDLEDEPLLWWKHHATEFPILAKLARKCLCVCAMSAASERLFSTSGNIVTPRRSCLKPDKVNMLVFLANNL